LLNKSNGGIFHYLALDVFMKALFIRLTLISLLTLIISSCGNKGDLYMPDKDSDKTSQKP
jgi:predicted small lipoprotein YifL